MFEFEFTPEIVVAVVAAVLAFLFDYFPGVAEWFDALAEANKKRLMLGLLALTVVIVFVGDCYALFATVLTCDVPGAVEAVKLLLAAIAVNQGVHLLAKPTEEYKERRLFRG